jgi:hypothetical protein
MGHSPCDVWDYTPREVAGFLDFARRRKKLESADLLSLHAVAACGDGEAIKSQHRDLLRGV